jgi:hypothetical protein
MQGTPPVVVIHIPDEAAGRKQNSERQTCFASPYTPDTFELWAVYTASPTGIV